MKILICLAMSCGLTAILYFYLKQRLGVIETRLNTLTELAQTLATELYQKEKQQLENEQSLNLPLQSIEPISEPISDSESDSESGSKSGSESDSESESDAKTDTETDNESMPPLEDEVIEPIEPIVLKEVKIEPETKQIPLVDIPIEFDVEPIVVCKKDVSVEPLIEVSDDESVKKVAVDNEYSKFSLKDLKQKVNDLGGPPLKTKQALINYLKKKV